MDRKFEIGLELERANANLAYGLRVFGDELAKRNNYREHEGIDAVHFYLVEKYRWLPSVVKAMSVDDLRFLLTEEMSGWTYPPEARPDRE